MDNEFETEKPFIVTTADMLEIVAGGGNGSEYVDIVGLLETAAKELRTKDEKIEQLREVLQQITELSPFKSFLDLQSMLLAGYPLANKPLVDGHPTYLEELRNIFHRNLFGNAEPTQRDAGAIRACL